MLDTPVRRTGFLLVYKYASYFHIIHIAKILKVGIRFNFWNASPIFRGNGADLQDTVSLVE